MPLFVLRCSLTGPRCSTRTWTSCGAFLQRKWTSPRGTRLGEGRDTRSCCWLLTCLHPTPPVWVFGMGWLGPKQRLGRCFHVPCCTPPPSPPAHHRPSLQDGLLYPGSVLLLGRSCTPKSGQPFCWPGGIDWPCRRLRAIGASILRSPFTILASCAVPHHGGGEHDSCVTLFVVVNF